MSTICIAALACKAGAFFGLALRLPAPRQSKPDEQPRTVHQAQERKPRASLPRATGARKPRR
jgi:hypothetical protein